MKHFKLTSESKINFWGITLYRIELLIDCQWGNIGDKGGWLEKDKNIFGNAWVSGDAEVFGNAKVSGDAEVSGNAKVFGNAWVSGDAKVSGDAWEKSPLQIQGSKHFFSVSSKTEISIGCHRLTFEKWQSDYQNIGADEGYSEQEIAEYGLYIELAFKLYRS